MDNSLLLYVEYKILKELFLARVYLYIYGVPLLKKKEMEATCNFFLFLEV
jgi:hypothetical protein